jgi:hypothetical protein
MRVPEKCLNIPENLRVFGQSHDAPGASPRANDGFDAAGGLEGQWDLRTCGRRMEGFRDAGDAVKIGNKNFNYQFLIIPYFAGITHE